MKLDVPGLEALDVADKRVLVRVDFNVPQDEEGRITDDTRIRAALPTIEYVLERGGRVVLMSHLGRPKGRVVEHLRLDPVARRLAELSGREVEKLDGSAGAEVEARVGAAGAIVLLENVRFHPGETKGDPDLVAAFARLGDVFVNDAFGTSHREHASVCGPARLLPSAAGLLLQRELDAFRRVLDGAERPFVAILGGAKVSDKLRVVGNLSDRCDALLIGGGMAYTFLAAQGRPIGSSLVQEDRIEEVRIGLAQAEEKGCRILVPEDHVVAARFDAEARAETCDEIPADRMGLDIGPRARERFAAEIAGARTVVWNGPMGVFEWPAFRAGTAAIGRAVAETAAYTVVGGGDSVAAVELLDLGAAIDHISTGGGASLELLEGRVLPGIAALSER